MHGGNLRWAREKFGRESYIDLSANINPFGPPEGVLQSLQIGLGDISHYPDPESKELTEVLSHHLKLNPQAIIIGNGAGELIFTMLQALKPQEVLIPVPAFSEYERAARVQGANINYFPLGADGWNTLPAIDVWQEALGKSDLLFLCTPHNPTGSVMKKEHFERILMITHDKQSKDKQCTIIVDESFYDFLPVEDRWSARSYLNEYKNLIILYSMTKFYSIPGLRLGAAFGHPDLIKRFMESRDPWSVNVLAQKAGIAAINDRKFITETQDKLAEVKNFIFSEFGKRSNSTIKVLPSSVNFILIQLLRGNSTEVTEKLAMKGILVRDCKNFQGLEGEYIRIAIRDLSSMKSFFNALDEVFNDL